jgi:TPR repeat protein
MHRTFALLLLMLGTPAFGAELDDAHQAYEAGRYVEAQGKLLTSARKGDREAQELLGMMYAFGEDLYPGVKRDPRAAVSWLQRAAGSRHATPRYVHCALLRKQSGKQLGPLQCFDAYSNPDAIPRTTTSLGLAE